MDTVDADRGWLDAFTVELDLDDLEGLESFSCELVPNVLGVFLMLAIKDTKVSLKELHAEAKSLTGQSKWHAKEQ